MKKYIPFYIILCLFSFTSTGCKQKLTVLEDDIYSRHLQKHFKLSIISTKLPKDKSTINLLILNDGQDIEQLRLKKIVDSLFNKKLINPLVIVAVHAGNREQEYGVAGLPDYQNRGSKADKYDDFINDELYPYIKKKTVIRKFNTVTIAGCSLGGLSAFDIAWNHADKIDKVGVFSGSFWWRDKDGAAADYSDEVNRIMLTKIKSSRKKPALKFWFYIGDKEEESDRDKDGIIDAVDDTKDLLNIIKSKNICSNDDLILTESANGEHNYSSWSTYFPQFLIWAVGKNN